MASFDSRYLKLHSILFLFKCARMSHKQMAMAIGQGQVPILLENYFPFPVTRHGPLFLSPDFERCNFREEFVPCLETASE